VLALAGVWVASVAVRVDHASHRGRWVDRGGGERCGGGFVSDAHVMDADSAVWVATIAVGVNHAAE
jgi:hypothetical protein